MMPAISVVMPVYNAERYIQTAVYSIINQSFADWELIVVDDGSTDASVRMVAEVCDVVEHGDRIRILQGEHRGCAAATHQGTLAAQAPIVTVVDADDFSYPYALEIICYHMYRKRKLGFLWSKFVYGSTFGERHTMQGWAKSTPQNMSLLEAFTTTRWWGGQHQRALRRDQYLDSPGLDVSIPYAVDLQLAVVMATTKCQTAFVDYVLYWYRRHRSQITGKHRKEQTQAHKDIIRKLKQEYRGQLGGEHIAVRREVGTDKIISRFPRFFTGQRCAYVVR